jgi:protoporphyrinogen oxidase
MSQPINTNRPIRVIIIGGGASGLLMAYKLQRNFDDVDFEIYEKNLDVRGT